MTRNRRAWELNDLTIRIVRNMLLHDDVDSLLETGSGTPDEATLMVRCYELAAMELWDESALIEAATVAGMDDGFTLCGESPERIHRKITIAIKTKSGPEYMPPPDGIKLLYRLGVLVYDELEETVTRLAAIGRYDTTEPQQKAPVTDTAPVVTGGSSGNLEELDYSVLATPAALLDAFEKWGMKAAWFDELNSHKWLLDARRRKGQGQTGNAIPPMFCPYAVMCGLVNKVRKATRLKPDTAWRTLAHKFPKVHAAFESHDPRERTGD